MENVYSTRNCYRAYSKAKVGHLKSPSALKWMVDPYIRCCTLESKLSSRLYEYGPYHDFYVYEPHRRRGYGAAMIRAVEALAESQSFGQIMTHVFHTNKVAIAMFTKRGYAPFGGEADGSIFLRKVYFEVPQH